MHQNTVLRLLLIGILVSTFSSAALASISAPAAPVLVGESGLAYRLVDTIGTTTEPFRFWEQPYLYSPEGVYLDPSSSDVYVADFSQRVLR